MIRHLLLLHPSGVPLFTSSFEEGIDCCSDEHKHHSAVVSKSTLFSSFLTSINSLAGEFGGKLKHMKLGQWDVFMENHEEITGVLLAKPSDDHSVHDKYTNALTEIIALFFNKYKLEIERWNGEVSKFQPFKRILNGHEIIKIDGSDVELCNSCIEAVSKVIENIIE